jgi:ADP-ribosyl-[dinitrogen reductase] hydrolase
MHGAIAGDIIGSYHEVNRIKTKEFDFFTDESQFTDDSVLTISVAHAILTGQEYWKSIVDFGARYYDAGFSAQTLRFINENCYQPTDHVPKRVDSFGNGAAMKISPIGWAFDSISDVLREAKLCSEPSHCHPEGIKGAQSVALAVFLARIGHSKQTIKEEITNRFGYDLDRKLDAIRPTYEFDVTCPGSVPEGIICFLESVDFEDAIRNAVSLGGDADTQACIAGAIAQAYYKEIPEVIIENTRKRLPEEFINIVDDFNSQYIDR